MTELSIHFERVTTEATNVVKRSKLDYVYLVDPPAINPFPRQRVVGRIYDEREQTFVGQGAWGADKWWFQNKHRVAQVAPYLHAIITCNEPNAEWLTVNQYIQRWIQICRDAFPSLNTVAGSFSNGKPEPEEAILFASCLQDADYVGFHEYWAPQHWRERERWIGWLMGRYKKFMDHLPPELRDKPIFITECGCDGLSRETLHLPNEEKGWKEYYPSEEAYLADLEAYLELLDDRVRAAFVYEAGPWPRWRTYEIGPSLAQGIINLNRPKEEEAMKIRVLRRATGVVEEMDFESYLAGVVPKEIYPTWPPPVREAQAVWARSWALYQMLHHTQHPGKDYDVCDGPHCQVYGDTSHILTDTSVDRTKGIVMVDSRTGEVVPGFYSKACGGTTEDRWDPKHLVSRNDCPCQNHEWNREGHGHGGCQWGAYYLHEDRGLKTWQEITLFYFENVAFAGNYGADEMDPPPPSDFEKRLHRVEEELASIAEEEAFGQRFLVRKEV